MSIKQHLLIASLLILPLTVSARMFTVVLDQGSQTSTAQEFLFALQQELQEAFPQTRIVLAETAQETMDPLQTASFSNRIKADLNVSFHVVIKKETQKSIRTYYCAPSTLGRIQPTSDKLSFTPARKAYEEQAPTSKKYAHLFVDSAKNAAPFDLYAPTPLALKPLQGIQAPSFLVEIEMSKPKEWKLLLPQIFEGLKEVLTQALATKKEAP